MILPADFIYRTCLLIGEEAYKQLEHALQNESPTSIRFNPSKQSELPDLEPVPWCATGRYLTKRIAFTFDPLFHAGVYYVQEASSMFLEQVIRAYVDKPAICLDLCAAPGGKSTHLHSLLPEGSVIVSNEVIRSRSYVLMENVQKWGTPNTIITNNAPEELGRLRQLFDVILTDVPCSGEGMFRKDRNSIGEWSVANVELCATRQRRILHDVWDALKPGGLLIYSTCTYNSEEDEENVQYIIEELGAEPLTIPIPATWHIGGALRYSNPVYRFFPHQTKGEGFFLAVMRKEEGKARELRLKSKGRKERKVKGKGLPVLPKEVDDYLNLTSSYIPVWRDSTLYMQTPELHSVYARLQETLCILSAGVEVGELKGKDLIPAPSLALSHVLNRDAFPQEEVDWHKAIGYLRKETLSLSANMPKGYVLLTYKGCPIGFVKNLGNRANNLYPQEWRIRSSYTPEEPQLL